MSTWRPVAVPAAASSTFPVVGPGTRRPALAIRPGTTVAPEEKQIMDDFFGWMMMEFLTALIMAKTK